MKFDGKAFGEEFAAFTKAYVLRTLEPLQARLDAAEKRVAELEARPAAKDGVDGVDGKDGLSVDLESLKTMIDEAVAALPKVPTAEEVAALVPMPKDGVDGKDGAPGKDGADGRDGNDGKGITIEDVAPLIEEVATRKVAEIPRPADGKDGIDGKDGAGLAGVLKDHEGCLVFTLTDGAIVKLGKVDGKDGEPGKDGAPGRDIDLEAVRASIQEEVQKQVTAPLADAYKGVWKPGAYKRGQLVTWGGSVWFAKGDTEAKPESDDTWTLIVKRGRDGKDGEAPKPPATVKLK